MARFCFCDGDAEKGRESRERCTLTPSDTAAASLLPHAPTFHSDLFRSQRRSIETAAGLVSFLRPFFFFFFCRAHSFGCTDPTRACCCECECCCGVDESSSDSLGACRQRGRSGIVCATQCFPRIVALGARGGRNTHAADSATDDGCFVSCGHCSNCRQFRLHAHRRALSAQLVACGHSGGRRRKTVARSVLERLWRLARAACVPSRPHQTKRDFLV